MGTWTLEEEQGEGAPEGAWRPHCHLETRCRLVRSFEEDGPQPGSFTWCPWVQTPPCLFIHLLIRQTFRTEQPWWALCGLSIEDNEEQKDTLLPSLALGSKEMACNPSPQTNTQLHIQGRRGGELSVVPFLERGTWVSPSLGKGRRLGERAWLV